MKLCSLCYGKSPPVLGLNEAGTLREAWSLGERREKGRGREKKKEKERREKEREGERDMERQREKGKEKGKKKGRERPMTSDL